MTSSSSPTLISTALDSTLRSRCTMAQAAFQLYQEALSTEVQSFSSFRSLRILSIIMTQPDYHKKVLSTRLLIGWFVCLFVCLFWVGFFVYLFSFFVCCLVSQFVYTIRVCLFVCWFVCWMIGSLLGLFKVCFLFVDWLVGFFKYIYWLVGSLPGMFVGFLVGCWVCLCV